MQYVTATVVALTTTFTAPAAVHRGRRLAQLSSPGFEIWVHEPQPVPGTRDCYPPQFKRLSMKITIYNVLNDLDRFKSIFCHIEPT